MAGTGHPDVTVPFGMAEQSHLLKVTGEGWGGARGLNPGVRVALLPSSPGAPKMRSPLPVLMGCRKLQRGREGSGIPSFRGGFRKAMEHPKSGGTQVLGEQHPAVLGKGL